MTSDEWRDAGKREDDATVGKGGGARAVTAFLSRGIRLPEDVKVVPLFNACLGPVYSKSFTRFEIDPVENGERARKPHLPS